MFGHFAIAILYHIMYLKYVSNADNVLFSDKVKENNSLTLVRLYPDICGANTSMIAAMECHVYLRILIQICQLMSLSVNEEENAMDVAKRIAKRAAAFYRLHLSIPFVWSRLDLRAVAP